MVESPEYIHFEKQGAFKFYLIKPISRLRAETFWNSNFVTTSAG